MSLPRATVVYLVVFREQQQGMNQRALSSVANVMRFIETEEDNESRGCGSGGYDIYYVDIGELEIAPYDVKPLKALMRSPKGKGR